MFTPVSNPTSCILKVEGMKIPLTLAGAFGRAYASSCQIGENALLGLVSH